MDSAGRWPVGWGEKMTRVAESPTTPRSGGRAGRRIVGLLDDAAFLFLAVWLFPAAILVVGIPIALFIRLLLDLANRM
jgi:hypothetical protein